ncbi:hypothetical protein G7Y89_g4373 [Cudoniella acicularis]|uniref:Methyltransferase domain-containing protein n=1 Tax=Cudoniella acicularis TaxID=354080 RepID=A0A8H4RQW9_9HELO|nr:hypothetical protein G7Y89_g4373 [Cudoniella acicularis]
MADTNIVLDDKFSKELRWYYKSLDSHISPASRKLLEEYSHIPAVDVDSHIYKMRDILWSQAPYPCIGEFKFLTLNLPKHPLYTQVLTLLRETPHTKLLDLGCAVAQELRSLTHAGIPSSNLYGSDLNSSYLTTSYALFNDAETFKGTLFPADIFSPELFTKEFKGWEGMFRVIHAGLFLHLFSWEQQIEVCSRIIKMLSPEKGSIFLGEMVGCQGSNGHARGRGAKFWKVGTQEMKNFLHDEVTFPKMWEEVAEKMGTVGGWKVESKLKVRGEDVRAEKEKTSFFAGEGIGWFTFSVERV